MEAQYKGNSRSLIRQFNERKPCNMTLQRWKIGLHVQNNSIRAVALILRRGGWKLCRHWQIPVVQTGFYHQPDPLIHALTRWRNSLPLRHEVRLGFCAARTVQRQLPNPGVLRETECERYIASSTAQQMQIEAGKLCWDYYLSHNGDKLNITAAHHEEIALFRRCAQRLGFNLVAVTPDACALAGFFPWLPAQVEAVVFYDSEHWLWATREQWGALNIPPQSGFSQLCSQLALRHDQIMWCGNLPETPAAPASVLDPWLPVSYPSAPPATVDGSYVIALGLAIGRYSQ